MRQSGQQYLAGRESMTFGQPPWAHGLYRHMRNPCIIVFGLARRRRACAYKRIKCPALRRCRDGSMVHCSVIWVGCVVLRVGSRPQEATAGGYRAEGMRTPRGTRVWVCPSSSGCAHKRVELYSSCRRCDGSMVLCNDVCVVCLMLRGGSKPQEVVYTRRGTAARKSGTPDGRPDRGAGRRRVCKNQNLESSWKRCEMCAMSRDGVEMQERRIRSISQLLHSVSVVWKGVLVRFERMSRQGRNIARGQAAAARAKNVLLESWEVSRNSAQWSGMMFK